MLIDSVVVKLMLHALVAYMDDANLFGMGTLFDVDGTIVDSMDSWSACNPSIQAAVWGCASWFSSWPSCQCWNSVELIHVHLGLIKIS